MVRFDVPCNFLLTMDFIEIFGAITGLAYLYFEIKQKVWLWPLGIITSSFYIYIFFASKFYADMGLQVYYLIISIYGWYHWLHGNNKTSKKELSISRINPKTIFATACITIALFVALQQILDKLTDSPIPIGDAFTTALSITATWMLARKIIEHWYLWVVINAVSLGLYIYKGLYPTSVLFLFNTVMSVVGYFQWKKQYLIQNDDI